MKNEKRAVIFDLIRTLYDPVSAGLYDGVHSMLSEISEERTLVLYSRRDRSRRELLEEMKIAHLFKAAYFVAQKSAENLKEILDANGLSPEECVVVGDMIASELIAAGELGIDTVWFKQQSFSSLSDEYDYTPTHTVHSISEMHTLLKRLP